MTVPAEKQNFNRSGAQNKNKNNLKEKQQSSHRISIANLKI